MLFKLFLLLALSSAIVTAKLQRPITRAVQTNDGGVRGIYETSRLTEKSFYAFRGIPYAKPPIDDRRFKVTHLLWLINIFLFTSNTCISIDLNIRHRSQSSHGTRMLSMHTITVIHACNRIPMRLIPAPVKIAYI